MTSSEQEHKHTNFEELRRQRQEVLENVLDLLEKAEERSAEEPENETKWRKILNHLWKSLDEAKVRLSEAEALYEREQEKASRHPQPSTAADAGAPTVSATIQEMDSYAGHTRPVPISSPGRTFNERRRQIVLRCAIDKVKDRRVTAMTFEEIDLAIEFLNHLTERKDESKEDNKLTQFLARTNIKVEEARTEMRRHRAQLYAKKTR